MPKHAQEANGVTALNAGEGVLNFFWNLASLDEATREEAASSLVAELAAKQAEYERDGGANDELDGTGTKGEPIAKEQQVAASLRRCCPLVVYAVKRLCRGLSSGRQGARQGFSLALASLLESTHCISPADMLTLLAATLEPSGSLASSDMRDALLGLMFGYGAVVRGSSTLDADVAKRIAAATVQLALKKSFLKEAAAAILLELAARLDNGSLASLLAQVDELRSWLAAAPGEASPESLLLALRLWHRMPAAIRAACPLLPAGHAVPPATLFDGKAKPTRGDDKAAAGAAAAFFTDQHMRQILPVLHHSTYCHPRLHSAWPTLLALLIPGFTLDKEQRFRSMAADNERVVGVAELRALWTVAVEDDIFMSASHERKYLGFTLLTMLLPYLGAEHVPIVLTPNFLRALSNNLTNKETYLHATAKKCLDRISNFVEKASPEARVAAAVALQRHGGAAFDRLRKTKAAAKVTEDIDAASLQAYVQQLQAKFAEPDGDGEEEDVIRRQLWAVEQLNGVLKQPGAEPQVKLGALKFLAVQAFFATDPTAVPQPSKGRKAKSSAPVVEAPLASRRLCASRLIVLTDSLSRPPPQQQSGKKRQGGVGDEAAEPAARQPIDYLGEVATFAAALRDSGAVSAYEQSEAAEQAADCLSALQKRLAQLSSASGGGGGDSRAARVRSLQHLVCLLELHTLGNPAAADAETASDLDRICSAALDGSAGKSAVDAPHWMDTLVDVLLSLLAQSSAPLPTAPLRDAAERLFRAFSEELTATGMEDLLRVVAQPLEGANNEEEDVYEDGSSEEEEESGEESDEEEAGGSEEEGEGEEEEDDVDVEMGEDDIAVDDATDEQMFRMDARLAAYFSTLRGGRTGANSNRRELLNFKMRVLALLESFVKKSPGSPLLLEVPTPLLSALVVASKPGGDRVLAERLAGLVHRLCRSKPEAGSGSLIDLESVAAQLRHAMYLASRSHDKRVAGAAAAAYTFLQRAAACSATTAAALPGVATDSAMAMLSDFFAKKKSRLSRAIFVDIFRRLPVLAAALLPALLEQAVGARTDYLRGEAFALVDLAVKVNDSQLNALVTDKGDSLAELMIAAVSWQYNKPQRHVEALKVACHVAEGLARKCGGATAILGAPRARDLLAEAQAAMGSNAKVDGQLRRLRELLQSEGGGSGKASGKRKVDGKPDAARSTRARKQKV